MLIPRFSTGTFNERIAGGEPRKAFKAFAAEVLGARHPGRVVIDYRSCADVAELKRLWEEIAGRLRSQLSDPSGQQGAPSKRWYLQGAEAMTGYRFVTDRLIADRSGLQALQSEMQSFFQELSMLPHLTHLGAVDVAVVDWMAFAVELRRRPDLRFRWFPSTRPRGLMPLDDGGKEPPFRSFLTSAGSYYSRGAHARAFPDAAGAPPLEDDLLSLLEQNTGLIITGREGSGKTRLTWELGNLARENGWLVLQASATFGDEAVDELLTHFGSPTNVLLLLDQIEPVQLKAARIEAVQVEEARIEGAGTFPDRIEHLEQLNATLPHRIRYIANCRTSHYRKVEAIPNHAHVDVSPQTGNSAAWLDSYRRAAVQSVLTAARIYVTPAHLEVCGDSPLFAVVMAFLRNGKRTDELRELVADGDLGSWLMRRVGQGFGEGIGPELALFVTAFPMPENARDALSGTSRGLFERLAADGWIETVTGVDGLQWVVVHDVLADRVLLHHLEHLGADIAPFIDALFDFAEANGAIAAVLASLQRIADAPKLQSVEWAALFAKWLSRFTPQWLEVARFLYSALLDANDDRALLEEPLRRWLALHAATESAQFVCVAWLDAGGDRALVEEPLRRWLILHAEDERAHFIYLAWLGAGGDRTVVDEPLRRWLARHADVKEAGPVYTAWLNTGGNPALVEGLLRRWLMVHGEAEMAGLVYGAWLAAEGARGVVELPLVRWLTRHPEPEVAGLSMAVRLKRQRAFNAVRDATFAAMTRLRESAEGSFASKALTKQRDLPDETVLDILTWCRHFPGNEDALWRLGQLEEAIARPRVAAEACETAELVLEPWLDAASLPVPRMANNVTRVFAAMTHFTDPALRDRAGAMLARWLRHPYGFDRSGWCPPSCVNALVAEVRTLIARGVVGMADAAAIERFARWRRHRIAIVRRGRRGG